MKKNKVTAILLAAGAGSRMNSQIKKQYMPLSDYPVLYYSLSCLERSRVDAIVLVTGADEINYCKREIVERYGIRKVTDIVAGGRERYASVKNGLMAAEDAEYVLIHDGARPFITEAMIADSIEAVQTYGACTVAVPAKDTIKVVSPEGIGEETLDRSRLWNIQTPQTFRREQLLSAYEKMEAEGAFNVTDDTMIWERYVKTGSKMIMGSYSNIKITTPEDIPYAEYLLSLEK